MRASDYAKAQPLEEPPEGEHVPVDLRRQAILDALRGAELGAHDRRIVDWMADRLDDSTSRTLVSLLLRVRDATTIGLLDLAKHLEDLAKTRLDHPGRARWAAGNSGAGGPL
jgi:hypothetical protein